MKFPYPIRAGASTQWTRADIPVLLATLLASIRQIRQDLPEITDLAEKVAEHHLLELPVLDEIWTMTARLRSRLLAHMDMEERVAYPRIERNCNALDHPESYSYENLGPCFELLQHEHNEIALLLSAIRHAADGFMPPPGACASMRELFRRLEALESTLRHNTELEENVLFPLAIQCENELNRATRTASGMG